MGNRTGNRRMHARWKVAGATASCTSGLQTHRYQVRDVSVEGVFLSGGPLLHPGDPVDVHLTLPEMCRIYVAGYVVRRQSTSRDPGIGVMFVERSPDLVYLLDGPP